MTPVEQIPVTPETMPEQRVVDLTRAVRRNEVPIHRLRELFTLVDGRLINRVTRNSHARIGDEAGHRTPRGYRKVSIDGTELAVHRIVFAMTHGRWPNGEIDHIDGNPSNNKPENLRDVSRTENLENTYKPRAHNKIGLLGVSPHKKGFISRIKVKRKTIYLGFFPTPEAAHAAYKAAKARLHISQRSAAA